MRSDFLRSMKTDLTYKVKLIIGVTCHKTVLKADHKYVRKFHVVTQIQKAKLF